MRTHVRTGRKLQTSTCAGLSAAGARSTMHTQSSAGCGTAPDRSRKKIVTSSYGVEPTLTPRWTLSEGSSQSTCPGVTSKRASSEPSRASIASRSPASTTVTRWNGSVCQCIASPGSSRNRRTSTVSRRMSSSSAIGEVSQHHGSPPCPVADAYPDEMARLFAATGDAIVRLEETDGTWVATRSLEAAGAQCLAVDPNRPETVFAGLREGGARRSDDAGASWVDCALPEPGVFSLAVSPADGTVYAGTEPSRLFASGDRGTTWNALDALLDLPSRPTWSFPPRPWTSHVRWIAPSPHDHSLLLAGIELGGLMRSV